MVPLAAKSPEKVVVEKGRLICYRIFDVGDGIALDAVQALTAREGAGGRRLALARGAKTLEFATPPLDVTIGPRTLALGSGEREATMSARLFDYGAVSISMDIPIHPGTDLADLLPLCDELYESRDLDACALKEVDALLARIAAAVEHPHGWRVPETYTIVFLEQLAEPLRGEELLAWPPLAKLLVGERSPRPFSAQQTADVLEHAHSYFDDDLVVVDWNSALVLEPTGNREICDILELATSQLLELRYYDGLFDKELARIYDRLERAGRELALFRSPYMKVAREAERRIVELTEFTERVDNSLKIIGDFYLARVYEAAVRSFRIGSWRASIDGKQALIAQAYGLIRAEMDARRSTVLELVVIILILTEIVLAFFRR